MYMYSYVVDDVIVLSQMNAPDSVLKSIYVDFIDDNREDLLLPVLALPQLVSAALVSV